MLRAQREAAARREARRKEKEARLAAQREAAQKEEAALHEIRWQCARCGKGLCQVDIREGRAVQEQDKFYCAEHLPKLRKCPACGREISRTISSCPHCGEHLAVLPELLRHPKPVRVKTERFYPAAQYGRYDKQRYFVRTDNVIPTSWWWLGLLIPLVGFILGIVAVAERRQSGVLFLVVMWLFGGIVTVVLFAVILGGCVYGVRPPVVLPISSKEEELATIMLQISSEIQAIASLSLPETKRSDVTLQEELAQLPGEIAEVEYQYYEGNPDAAIQRAKRVRDKLRDLRKRWSY